jgi:hypothetical protein
MKVTKFIVPMLALSTLNNPNYQVQAVQSDACVQGCVVAHSIAAKACSAGVYFPPAFVACQLAASAALATCIYLCNNPR